MQQDNYTNIEQAIHSIANILQQAYSPPRYIFRAYRTANYTAAGGAVAFNAVKYDTANAFDTSNYQYVIPRTGYWQFNWRIGHNLTAGTGYYSALKVNGSSTARGSGWINYYTNASAWGGTTGSTTLFLEEGDVVRIDWTGTTNTIVGTSSTEYTYFDGYLITEG